MRRAFWVVLVLSLATPLLAKDRGAKSRKPQLELRATPRMAFPPAYVTVMADLRGGDEVEDYYCPELEWDWNDGAKSSHEADCPPFAPGAVLERHYSAEHAYPRPGVYNVKLTLRRAGRALAVASATITVAGGPGEGARPYAAEY